MKVRPASSADGADMVTSYRIPRNDVPAMSWMVVRGGAAQVYAVLADAEVLSALSGMSGAVGRQTRSR
jgi:hypothetical protein